MIDYTCYKSAALNASWNIDLGDAVGVRGIVFYGGYWTDQILGATLHIGLDGQVVNNQMVYRVTSGGQYGRHEVVLTPPVVGRYVGFHMVPNKLSFCFIEIY